MKLRFKGNSVRLRLNQTETRALAAGKPLEETLTLPGGTAFSYRLMPHSSAPEVIFHAGVLTVCVPSASVHAWEEGEEIGIYFDVPTTEQPLRVAIEKDLECVDGPPEERDVDAFPRLAAVAPHGKNC